MYRGLTFGSGSGVWTFIETTTTVGIRVSMAPLLNQRLWVPCRVTDFSNTDSAPWPQKAAFPLTVVHRPNSDRGRSIFSDFRPVTSLHVQKLPQPLSGQSGASRLWVANQAA